MIGSLLDDLHPIERNDPETPGTDESRPRRSEEETDALVASLLVAERIVRRRRFVFWRREAADILQAIALRLVKWRAKHVAKGESMSEAE